MTRRALWLVALAVLSAAPAWSRQGRIAGRLVDPAGAGVGGVSVSSSSFTATALTDAQGRYSLSGLPSGEHELFFSLGDHLASEAAVTVRDGESTELLTVVDWDLAFAETITVHAASRRRERIVEAPAAISSLSPQEIARRAAQGQLPRLLATVPGAELAQGGLYDYNVNTRGFNGSTNRRVLTLIDGRDPSQPVFAGAQEWAAISFALDDLESVELVRGPGAALYGAGAYNGVLDLRTRSARDSVGGRLRLALGELDTVRGEARWAGGSPRLGFVKLQATRQTSDNTAVSRVGMVEYEPELLPQEVIAPPLDRVEVDSFGVRWERDLGPRHTLTVEAATATSQGTTLVTGLGRLQRTDVARPWARLDLGSPRWNLLASSTERDSDGEVSLAAGSGIYLDSARRAVEVQGNRGVLAGRGQLVGGASWITQQVDSADPAGRQTLFDAAVDSHHRAVYGQLSYDLSSRWSAVASLRWDDSDLHEARWSPRAAVVFALSPRQTLRLSYGEAFQSPTLSEKYVRVAVAPPLDLSPLEEALAPLLGGVPLGLDAVPLLAVGNEALDVEEVTSLELGYSAVLGDRIFLTLSAYRSDLSHFTTNLIPLLGTSLGPLQELPAWQPPAALSPQAAAAVRAALAAALPPTFFVAAAADGSAYVPLLSFGSFGEVTTEGLELGLNARFQHWSIDAALSTFHSAVSLEAPENPLSPNRPSSQASLGAAWFTDDLEVSLQSRYSGSFDYRSGIFVGPVPSFVVSDLALRVRLDERWSAGLDVANLFDRSHYEAFGGDLLERRALAYATLSW